MFRWSLSWFVSMPCLGRFHFYHFYQNGKPAYELCQCPVSGDFISTELMFVLEHLDPIVSMPCLGRFHFYGKKN